MSNSPVKQHFHGPLTAHGARHRDHGPHAVEAHIDGGQAHAGVVGGYGQIAGGDQAGPIGRSHAVHLGDHRFFHAADGHQGGLHALDPRLVLHGALAEEVPHIDTRAKGLARTFEDNHPHRRISLQLKQCKR